MPPRLLLLIALLALPGTGCRDNDGAVKLTVSYSGFKPGCIRVGVKDAQGVGEPRTTELPGKGEASGGTVKVAEKELKLAATDGDLDGYVSPGNGGTDCDDASATRHPGAQELCNDRDDN